MIIDLIYDDHFNTPVILSASEGTRWRIAEKIILASTFLPLNHSVFCLFF